MRGTFGKGRVNKWEVYSNQKKTSEQSNSAPKTFDEEATYVLSIHQQDSYNGADMVFNPEIFPSLKLYDKLMISDFEGNQLIIQVQKESFTSELKNKNFQLSICKLIAENYNLSLDISNKMNVKLKIIEDIKNFELDIAEVSFKDQVLYRRDLYKLEKKLMGTSLYTGKTVTMEGVKGRVTQMVSKSGDVVHSGIVTESTKLVFRTLSSRYYILIEMSKEMCDCNINGELYLEKAIRTIKALLQRMEILHTHHKVAFILSARLYYPQFKTLDEAYNYVTQLASQKDQELNLLSANCTTFQLDIRGKVFQDVYHRVKSREVKGDWQHVISKIKETIFTFLRYINWKISINERLSVLMSAAQIVDPEGSTTKSPNHSPSIYDKSLMLDKYSSIAYGSHLDAPNFEESSPMRASPSSSQIQNMMNESSSDEDEPTETSNQNDDKHFCIPIECELSSSEYSNLLQSLNLVLSMYNHHQLSRTLTTTGHTMTVITAGEGKYFVDPNLARLTKECMVLGRVYCNILTMKDDIPYKEPLFMFQKNSENFYADLNNQETKDLLDLNKLIEQPQAQMISTNSMETFATFSLADHIDNKDDCPFVKNYVGLSHLPEDSSRACFNDKIKAKLAMKSFCLNSDKNHVSLDIEDLSPTEKRIYWLNLISGFSPEVVNSHSQIFTFPKTNPDPFFSLSSKSVKIYQPSFQIQQFIRDLPTAPFIPKSTKIAEVDKFLTTLIRPSASIFHGESWGMSKEALVQKMDHYDGQIFGETKDSTTAWGHNQCPEPSSPQEMRDDSDGSSDRSFDHAPPNLSFSHAENSNTVSILAIEKRNSAGNQSPVLESARSNAKQVNSSAIKSFSETGDPAHKLYSHYKFRWFLVKNLIDPEAALRNNMKMQKKINIKVNPSVLEFEDVWKNLTIPPLLPLHSKFFPAESEITDDKSQRYQKLQYYFNLSGDIKQKIEDFMDELVSQRLTLDFQLVEKESVDSYGKSSIPMQFNKFYRLSWGRQHHKIYLNQTDNLMCHIFTKKKQTRIGEMVYNVNFIPTYYRYLLFNDRGKGLVRKSVIFDRMKQINWNKFDLYVSNSMKDDYFERKDLLDHRVKVVSLIMLPIRTNGKLPSREDLISNFTKAMITIQEKLNEYGFRDSIRYSIVYKRKELRQLTKGQEETSRIVKIFLRGQASSFSHFYFEYDQFYCHKAGFHFKVHWFSCSGNTITDLIWSMNSTLRNTNFTMKFIPVRYRVLHAHPFESNLRINCKSETITNSLKKLVQRPPFNFVLDAFLDFTSFIHENGSIILYFFDKFIVWRDNRLIDTKIASTNDNDITTLCETLFRKLIASIHCLEILHDLIDQNFQAKGTC